VLKLLRREQGAMLAEIAKATEWQNHSIRGFISGQVTKKMGLRGRIDQKSRWGADVSNRELVSELPPR